jgi:hypothetical protein
MLRDMDAIFNVCYCIGCMYYTLGTLLLKRLLEMMLVHDRKRKRKRPVRCCDQNITSLHGVSGNVDKFMVEHHLEQ